jgi:peptide/nickel transport system substrate-binding protein
VTLVGKALSIVVVMVVAATACAAPGPPATQQPGPSAEAVQTPKVLTIADFAEPASIFGFNGKSDGGVGAVGGVVHDLLVQEDGLRTWHASLAAELPTVEKGTWQVNADGTMDVTWKLKPGVKWHDGTQFTSDDMVFTLMLNKDRDLPNADAGVARRMESATNPDSLTFVVHWSAVDVLGASGTALQPMPKHLMEDLYKRDKDAFLNSPLFRDGFVGLGPYQLTRWVQGSLIETTRFDDFHRGPAPMSRIVVRYFTDQNTAIANIQAGAVDVLMPKVVESDVVLAVRGQLEGKGIKIRVEPLPRMAQIEPMMRTEFARPVNGLPNVLVRRALSHAIDRMALSEVATGGLGPPADSWFDPTDPLRPQLESSIVKYPHDPNRALQLMGEAGWTRGTDGVLVHTSGEVFDVELWANPQTSNAIGTLLVDGWKRIGVNASFYPMPPAVFEDRVQSTRRPGPLLSNVNTPINGRDVAARHDGRELATEANRWTGRNRAGYQNPRADALYDLLNSTIDPRARLPLLQEQINIFTTDVVHIPLYWEPGNTMAVPGVKADIHPGNGAYRTDLWDRA